MDVRDPDAGRMARPKVGCGSDSDQGTRCGRQQTAVNGPAAQAPGCSVAADRGRQRPMFPVPSNTWAQITFVLELSIIQSGNLCSKDLKM